MKSSKKDKNKIFQPVNKKNINLVIFQKMDKNLFIKIYNGMKIK